jgi:hypothetical protein
MTSQRSSQTELDKGGGVELDGILERLRLRTQLKLSVFHSTAQHSAVMVA